METAGEARMWAVLPPAGAPAVYELLLRTLGPYRAQLDGCVLAAIDEFMRQARLSMVWQQETAAELSATGPVDVSPEAVPA